MISTKKLFTLTLAALLLAWVSHWASQGRDSGQDARIGQTLIQADLVDQMDGLSIQRGSVTLKLKRIGGGWKILSKGGYPANSAKLISLMQKIGTARINSLVSTDPSRQLSTKAARKHFVHTGMRRGATTTSQASPFGGCL